MEGVRGLYEWVPVGRSWLESDHVGQRKFVASKKRGLRIAIFCGFGFGFGFGFEGRRRHQQQQQQGHSFWKMRVGLWFISKDLPSWSSFPAFFPTVSPMAVVFLLDLMISKAFALFFMFEVMPCFFFGYPRCLVTVDWELVIDQSDSGSISSFNANYG